RGARRDAEPPARAPAARVATAGRRGASAAVEVGGQRITHPDRVVDPSTGLTKLDVARYYEAVAGAMLPHLRERPVSLTRAPDGIDGERFFQKHAPAASIPGIALLDASLDPGHAPLMAVPDRGALLGAAQMNVIELHTWNAKARAIERPDRIVFDLDPGEGVSWSRVQEAATLVRALLEELELESWLKTSGGKGLHVVVPIAPGPSWAAARGVSKGVVRHLARTLPDRFSARPGDAHRRGRIFVDYLRNGRGATTVAAWSLRARPGLGVSVPVAWDELPSLSSGAHWTLRDAPRRLEDEDPWAGAARRRQRLTTAMKALDDVGALPDEATAD
ncbi:MAG TPA: non-homologous end-joining DNA ligase, partial [Burkholderiaceae bacterium]|nr:non-homologous end-joining DNA ligase [Burkholderiaceae bacterium]